MRIIAVLSVVLLTACSANLEVPTGTQVSCRSDADCFNGQRCELDTLRCVDAAQACAVDTGNGFRQVANGTSCTQKSGVSGVCLAGQCLTSSCGDGYVDPAAGEECDNGAGNSDTAPSACRTNCRFAHCGDHVVDAPGEACDDGNVVSGDGCRADCKKIEVCNDAELDAGEACDDANDNPNDGCDHCAATTWDASLVVGAGGFGGTTIDVHLTTSGPVATDLQGHIYFGEFTCRILKIDRVSGHVTTIAGTGVCGSGGGPGTWNGKLARGTDIGNPRSIAVDSRGAVYFADNNGFIRRIDPLTGLLTHVAGTGGSLCAAAATCPSGVSPKTIPLASLASLAFDANDNLYYSESTAHVVRMIPAGQDVEYVMLGTLFASGNTFSDGATGDSVLLNGPYGIAADADSNLFVADNLNQRILVYDPNLDQTHLVAGITGTGVSSPDGSVAATSSIKLAGNTADLDIKRTGEVVFYEQGKLRMVDRNGLLASIAGTGTEGSTLGPALSSQIAARTLATFSNGDVVFSEALGTVGTLVKVRVVSGGIVSDVIANPPRSGQTAGQAPTSTPLNQITDVAVASNGDIYVSTQGPGVIYRVAGGTGDMDVVAGFGAQNTENVLGTDAFLSNPSGLHPQANGDLVFLDSSHQVVRKLDGATHMLSTLAGTFGSLGSTGDGLAATAAKLSNPVDIDVAPSGDIYIFDAGNFRIRKVTASTGLMSTIAGNGSACAGSTSVCGDGGTATAANLGSNVGTARRAVVRLAPNGDVVFSDVALSRIRLIVLADGKIQNIAGQDIATLASGGTCSTPAPIGTCGDGAAASSATFAGLGGIAIDGTGLLIADSYRLRRTASLAAAATISNVAYAGTVATFAGDGGSQTSATGGALIVTTTATAVYVADSRLVRKLAGGVVDTVVGLVDGVGDGPAALSEVASPHALTPIAAKDKWVIADGGGRVRMFDDTLMRVSSVVGHAAGFNESVVPGGLAKYVALLATPAGIAYDASRSKVYVSEAGLSRIRSVSIAGGAPATWTISTLLAQGSPSDVDGPIASATISASQGLAYDATRDRLWIADTGNNTVRYIDLAAGTMATLGGQSRVRGFAGDGGPVRDAYFEAPTAIAVDPVDGSVYIADTANNRVRRVAAESGGAITSDSLIDTVLGDGTTSASGSGSPARAFAGGSPQGLTFDSFGDLWVSTASSVRIVTAGADGVPTGDDAVLTVYGAPPRVTFPSSATTCLSGLVMRPGDASAYVLDGCLGFVVRLDRRPLP